MNCSWEREGSRCGTVEARDCCKRRVSVRVRGRERFECGGAGEGRGGVCGMAVAQWRPKTAVKKNEFGGVGGAWRGVSVEGGWVGGWCMCVNIK